MTCVDPYIVSIGRAFGCGRCYYCRIKRAKVWTHRIILESAQHKDNSFLTLTYSDEQLPAGGTLEPKHLQLFFKKLRKACEPSRIRFFAVGEYGSRTLRPHYHAALFGYPSCTAPYIRTGQQCTCGPCSGIAACWTSDVGRARGPLRGHFTLGTLEPASAAYVAKYATKSMEEGDKDVKYPDGCIPPFSRASLRPGIGAGVADDIASALLFARRETVEDIPGYLSHGKLRRPVGRYLRNKIRERIGVDKETATRVSYAKLDAEMQDMRAAALKAPPGKRSLAFRELLVSATEVKRLQIDTKAKIKKSVRKL